MQKKIHSLIGLGRVRRIDALSDLNMMAYTLYAQQKLRENSSIDHDTINKDVVDAYSKKLSSAMKKIGKK